MNSFFHKQMVQQNCQLVTTNSENPLWGGNQTVRSEDSSRELQGESQPTEFNRWRWRPKWFWSIQGDFICRHRNEPRVQLCAEGRNIPYSTEIHWCDQIYPYWFGSHAREAYWRVLERRFEQKFVRFLERFHPIHSIERKTSQRIYVDREETDESSTDYVTRSCMAWSMVPNWESRLASRRKIGIMTSRNWTTLDDWEASTLLIRKTKDIRRQAKMRGKLEVRMEAAMPCKKKIHGAHTRTRELGGGPRCIPTGSEDQIWL